MTSAMTKWLYRSVNQFSNAIPLVLCQENLPANWTSPCLCKAPQVVLHRMYSPPGRDETSFTFSPPSENRRRASTGTFGGAAAESAPRALVVSREPSEQPQRSRMTLFKIGEREEQDVRQI